MALENLKSTAITNLDASYITIGTSGLAAPGRLWSLTDNVTSTSGSSGGSTYRLCRFPSNAIVKQVYVTSAVASAGNCDINVAFSDSTTDGTTAANQGTIPQVSAANNKLFGAATAVVGLKNSDVTFGNTYTPVLQNMEMWNALTNISGGPTYAFDPGGFFDILLLETTTFTTGGIMGVEVRFMIGD